MPVFTTTVSVKIDDETWEKYQSPEWGSVVHGIIVEIEAGCNEAMTTLSDQIRAARA